MASSPTTASSTPTVTGTSAAPVTTPPTTSSTPTPTTTPTSTTPSTTPTTSSSNPTTTSSTTSDSSATPSTSSTSLSTSSSSTQTSSSASTTTTTSPTTSTTPTLTPSLYTSTSGGVVVTSYTYVTASPTPTSDDNTTTSSKSFFSNTGAVAGVFTVVGLVAVAIFIALVTNAVRRRRAQKFDRDVAEAAAEAAASSRSPFDDYTYNNGGGGGGGAGYTYSDTTHGTLNQAPMGLSSDAYGEMTQYDPYAAGAVSLSTANVGRARTRHDSETQRTPGIAGVGAGNIAREPSRRTPYHAFAGPGAPQPHETLSHTPAGRQRSRGIELLEGAGLAGTGVAAMTAANNGAYINRRPSQYTHQTHGSMRSRGHSQGHSSNENYPTPPQPVYQSPPRNDTQPAGAYTGFVSTPSPQPLLSSGFANPHETSPSPPPAQSHSPAGEIEGEDYQDDGPQRLSYADDEDYGQHNRVLRVANE